MLQGVWRFVLYLGVAERVLTVCSFARLKRYSRWGLTPSGLPLRGLCVEAKPFIFARMNANDLSAHGGS
jgi:hypothetical protein